MKSVSPFYHVVMCTLGAIFRFYYQFLSKYFFPPSLGTSSAVIPFLLPAFYGLLLAHYSTFTERF